MLATASRRQGLSAARWATGQAIHGKLPALSHLGAVSALQDAFVLLATNNDNNRNNGNFHNIGGIRFFAAAPSPENKEEKDEGLIARTFHRVLTPQNQFYALVAGGTLGAYAISKVFLSFTNFFTHLTPTVVAKWGFYTGFGCATGELVSQSVSQTVSQTDRGVLGHQGHLKRCVFCGPCRSIEYPFKITSDEANDFVNLTFCCLHFHTMPELFCGYSGRWTGTGNSRQYVHSCRSCL